MERKCRKQLVQEAVNGVMVTVNIGATAVLGLVAAGERLRVRNNRRLSSVLPRVSVHKFRRSFPLGHVPSNTGGSPRTVHRARLSVVQAHGAELTNTPFVQDAVVGVAVTVDIGAPAILDLFADGDICSQMAKGHEYSRIDVFALSILECASACSGALFLSDISPRVGLYLYLVCMICSCGESTLQGYTRG